MLGKDTAMATQQEFIDRVLDNGGDTGEALEFENEEAQSAEAPPYVKECVTKGKPTPRYWDWMIDRYMSERVL